DYYCSTWDSSLSVLF
nr:immunoglobulin light chain junction region [Macaca mulatta]MOX77837.1 immunoglobulin light chain junction region [Macaca mulatta]MOX77840.1 immunoglobulin light chain junction region [Macaca mulatta]MOX78035.1 immunoglobulin light chain junction region [Macaca mulatta]MOX78998.1 immunoglobulin light chain junction region [Macaca mulatta]